MSENYNESDFLKIEQKTIKAEDVTGVGIVFIKANDVLSRISIAITRQVYSTIGVYFETEASGIKKTIVLVRDVTGITGPSYLSQTTIKDLVQLPSVDEVAVKHLKGIFDDCGKLDIEATMNLECDFRTSSAKIFSNGEERSLTEITHQMLGHPISKPTKGNTGVEMVNKIIKEMMKDVQQSDEKTTITSLPDFIGSDTDAKIEMISLLASSFNQRVLFEPSVANKRLNSYLVENDLFNDLFIVEMEEKDQAKVDFAKKLSLDGARGKLSKMASHFIDLFLSDQSFADTVIDGFNETLGKKNDSINTSKLLLKMFNDLGVSGAQIFQKAFIKCEINGRDVQDYVDKLKNLKINTQKFLNEPLGPSGLKNFPCPKKGKIIVLKAKSCVENYISCDIVYESCEESCSYDHKGPTGMTGCTGYSGPTGCTGHSGSTGHSGYSGYSGPTGCTGHSGSTGYSGSTGCTGYSGSTGCTGYSGSTGCTGIKGKHHKKSFNINCGPCGPTHFGSYLEDSDHGCEKSKVFVPCFSHDNIQSAVKIIRRETIKIRNAVNNGSKPVDVENLINAANCLILATNQSKDNGLIRFPKMPGNGSITVSFKKGKKLKIKLSNCREITIHNGFTDLDRFDYSDLESILLSLEDYGGTMFDKLKQRIIMHLCPSDCDSDSESDSDDEYEHKHRRKSKRKT